MKMKYLLTIIALLCCSIVFELKASSLANELLGSWKYTVSDVPPEYEKGVMTFELNDNKTVGYIGQADKIEMNDLKIEKEKITFKLNLDGDIITVNLTQKGDKLTGTVVSPEGEFLIIAAREVKK
jgi:hypothetical protein